MKTSKKSIKRLGLGMFGSCLLAISLLPDCGRKEVELADAKLISAVSHAETSLAQTGELPGQRA